MKNVCILIKFIPTQKMPEEVVAFLEQNFAVVSVDYKENGKEQYVCYAKKGFNKTTFEAKAAKQGLTLPTFTMEELKEEEWLDPSTGGFEPLETKNFCIASALLPPPVTHKILLSINAAAAFGSTHPTTQMCLQAMEDLFSQNFTPKSVLDMGTGSGILALAASKLWKEENPEIVAVDIDSQATRSARANFKKNGAKINVAHGDGFKTQKVLQNKPYDLVLANILARPLREMAPALCACLNVGGKAVLSGFVDNQVDWVVEVYAPLGMKILRIYDINNRHALLMEKTK